MSNKYIIVNFEVHVPEDSIQSMISGIAAYGFVGDTENDLEFKVEVFKESKLPQLSKLLTRWENYGKLTWHQEQ
jgi:hypothetical protein